MKKRSKVIVIFLAYNASKTLAKFYQEFPKKFVSDIILVDDASKDKTYELAKKLGIRSFRNSVNLGYGGNMKRALRLALEDGADIIIDIHPDGEYKPSAIPHAIKKIEAGVEFVLGNRFTGSTNPLRTGMHIWKFIPILTLNLLDKIVLGTKVDDLHQGFRVYTRDLLNKVNFEENSNNYLFSFELIAQATFNHINIGQVPVETNYSGKKRGASLKNSIKYSLDTFKVLFLFILARLGFKVKLFQPKQLSA